MAAQFEDAARYLLSQAGSMSAMKLQKLMYYAQAWSLVWEEVPLFEDDFEAWANGPVLPRLYQLHRGQFRVDESIVSHGSTTRLNDEQRDTVKRVIAAYGSKTAQQLSDLTHAEDPWRLARGDLESMMTSNSVITKGSMHEYYSALPAR